MTETKAADLVGDGANPDPAVGLRAVAALRRLTEQLEDLQVATPAAVAGPGRRSPRCWVSPSRRCTRSTRGARRRPEGLCDVRTLHQSRSRDRDRCPGTGAPPAARRGRCRAPAAG